MQKLIVAFDCDGTLIDKDGNVNWRQKEFLMHFARLKNVEVIVWSGQGKEYAEMIVRMLDIEKYVKRCYSKNFVGMAGGKHQFKPDIEPHLAIDDIHACELGYFNLIVSEK